jgi:hypothetical protein
MKKTRRKQARLAKRGTDVVAVDMPDGSTEFSVNPKMAAMLNADVAIEIIETKDLSVPAPAPVADPEPAPVLTCGSCGAKAGRCDDGKVTILYPQNRKLICLACSAEQHAKALANAEVKDAKVGVVSEKSGHTADVTSDAEIIAAFMAYHDVSSQIIEKLVAERDETSSVSTTSDTKSQSMRERLSGSYGKRKKRRVALNDDRRTSPSQAAAAHAIGKHGLHTMTTKPKSFEDVGPAPFAYDAKGHTIPLCESCHGVGCPLCLGAGYTDPVDAMLRSKLAAIEARQAAQWQIEFDGSGFNFYRPQTKGVAFQDASVPDFESAVREIERAHKAAHPVSKSTRKF